MADDPKAVITPESNTQEAPMPSAEQKSSESVETVEVAEREAKPVETEKELTLPDDAKERTAQQFEKLKKELAKERLERSKLERAFNSNQPSQQSSSLPEWYDSANNTVDVQKLQQREQLLQREIANLRNQVSGVTRLSEKQQEVEAYQAYPELDPNNGKQFNEDFQKQVISYMATEFAEGKAPTIKEAADSIMRIADKVAKKAEQEGAKKALESLTPKEQAALEATGRSDKRIPSVDVDALRRQSRQSGRAGVEAVMQRLSKIQSVGN